MSDNWAQLTAESRPTPVDLAPISARVAALEETVVVAGVADPEDLAVREQVAYGTVTDAPRPADTATHTWERSIVNGVVTWSERPKYPEELAADTRTTNESSIEQAARAAVAANQATLDIIDDPTGPVQSYKATANTVTITTPANSTASNLTNLRTDVNALKNAVYSELQALEARRAQDRQALKWVFDNVSDDTLRQITALIRLVVASDLLDSTAGT